MTRWSVPLLALSASLLFVAVAHAGTGDDPYAPNDWLFSHAHLANVALERQQIPFNDALVRENGFAETLDEFRLQTGLERMTFYANTAWHFWNGLPLHPALLAGLSAFTGLQPEQVARVPVAGVAMLLLVYASADLLLSDGRARRPGAAALAPFLLALASAPFALDLRVLMPSTSLVVLALLLHLVLRRLLADDRRALWLALAPLLLLPFWYYTVSYFVILLFLGLLASNLALRAWRGSGSRPLVPLGAAALVPVLMLGVLTLNGALTSHLNMAQSLGSLPFVGAEAGSDYETRLNRVAWRSALLYVELALLFAPLAAIALGAAWRLVRRGRVGLVEGAFAQWCVGGAAFALVLQAAVGVSFLNRGAIYLTPVAALAFAWAVGRARPGASGRLAPRAAFALLAFAAIATPALVATAAPAYSEGDREAFDWMARSVPRDAVVYGSLDAASVLFREHGFHETLAFHPRTELLRDFWYGDEPAAMRPYLASFGWFVLRDDARLMGFEEFGPLREPIGDDAYEKFRRSPDMHLLYDNGEVLVFRVDLVLPDTARFN